MAYQHNNIDDVDIDDIDDEDPLVKINRSLEELVLTGPPSSDPPSTEPPSTGPRPGLFSRMRNMMFSCDPEQTCCGNPPNMNQESEDIPLVEINNPVISQPVSSEDVSPFVPNPGQLTRPDDILKPLRTPSFTSERSQIHKIDKREISGPIRSHAIPPLVPVPKKISRPEDPLQNQIPLPFTSDRNKIPNIRLAGEDPAVVQNVPEPQRRLAPSYPSGLRSGQRSPSLHQNISNLYPKDDRLTAISPTYSVGMPDSLKNKRKAVRRRAEPLYISADDDDLEAASAKKSHAKLKSLTVVPFDQQSRLMKERGKEFKQALDNSRIQYTPIGQYVSDEGGAEYIYQMNDLLERADVDMRFVLEHDAIYTVPEIVIRDTVVHWFQLLEEFRQIYNQCLYGGYLDSIFMLCACLNTLRHDIRRRLKQIDTGYALGIMRQYWNMNVKLLEEMRAMKLGCQTSAVMRLEIKKHADLLSIETLDKSWQTEKLTQGTADEYKELYKQRGRIYYHPGSEKFDTIPNSLYLQKMGMTPNQWVAAGKKVKDVQTPYERQHPLIRKIKEKSPDKLREELNRIRREKMNTDDPEKLREELNRLRRQQSADNIVDPIPSNTTNSKHKDNASFEPDDEDPAF